MFSGPRAGARRHVIAELRCQGVEQRGRHRDGFLRAVCDTLAGYSEDARGPGLLHREAAKLQRYFINAPAAYDMRSKYR